MMSSRRSIDEPLIIAANQSDPPSHVSIPAPDDPGHYDTNNSPFLDLGNPFTAWYTLSSLQISVPWRNMWTLDNIKAGSGSRQL